MISGQLNLREMCQRALMSKILKDDLNPTQAERLMRDMRTKSNAFAELMELDGLRKRPKGDSIEGAAGEMQANQNNMTRRQLKLELRETAAQQYAQDKRDDVATKTISF
jgi:hypothetical protein